jgi:ABC-2 type transport system ATP-binding protein
MIECDALTKYYGGLVAADHLTIRIPRQALCALVGPNGAGKTTTLRMLSTLLRPSAGRATIGGYDTVKEAGSVRRIIGYLPESFQLYEDLTVERYLRFFGRAYDLDPAAAAERTTDYLARLGLSDRRGSRISTLSRGMRQRLGVAKSFLHEPEVVLLDEPASGLDPQARAELRDFLKYQQYQGKTVLVSSHVLRELADFCDHILIIQHGRAVEFGRITGAEGVLARHSQLGEAGQPYSLKVLRDAPRLEVLLRDQPTVRNLRRVDTSFSFEFAGDEEEAAKLLARITAAGIPVTKFAAEEVDLEAVYKKVAGREGAPASSG